MNYPPKHHKNENVNQMINVIETYPLAMVISVKDNTPFITHLPLIYKDGQLIGHLDKNNPQANLLDNNAEVTVIFNGPQSYISPSIFKKGHLPTWNYVAVHVKGKVSEIENPELIKWSLIEMTQHLEAPDRKYQLDINDPKLEQFVNYVKGFKITITDWEGKFKLSKDKNHEDFERAKTALITSNRTQIDTILNTLFQ